jgi:hypothetical protein
MNIHFAPDLPIEDDRYDPLNFQPFAVKLQRAIYNTEPPFAYGVLGDWGAGKTSILNLLYNQISKNPISDGKAFIPIRFDAWQYENETNLLYPLLYAIKKDYLENKFTPGRPFLEKLKVLSLTGTLALADVALRAVSHATIGEGIPLKDLAEYFDSLNGKADEVEKTLSGWGNQVDQLNNAFHELLDCYAEDWAEKAGNVIKKDQVRFVFMVDDLDRCLPLTVIAILESIKNFLLTDNCLFVLALNPRVVYQGIRAKYAGLAVDGREYLEKILNYSFYVPEPLPEQAKEFACLALESLIDGSDRARIKSELDDFGNVVRECNFTNPRKVKRILNHYLFFLDLHEKELERYRMSVIARFIILAEYFPAIFQLFLKDAEEAATVLSGIGSDQFDVKMFEEKFGVEIRSIFPQLRYMQSIFEITPITDLKRAKLIQHAQEVFKIVHHPI